MERQFVHTLVIPCDWCNGTGLGGDYGGGPCYGCNGGSNTASEPHAQPAADDAAAFAAIDLDAAEALVVEALARAAVWCGTPFPIPVRSRWHRTGYIDSPYQLPSSLAASIERLAKASGTPLPHFETRSALLQTASSLYARLGDALDPFAPHLELLARGIGFSRDGDPIELVI